MIAILPKVSLLAAVWKVTDVLPVELEQLNTVRTDVRCSLSNVIVNEFRGDCCRSEDTKFGSAVNFTAVVLRGPELSLHDQLRCLAYRGGGLRMSPPHRHNDPPYLHIRQNEATG